MNAFEELREVRSALERVREVLLAPSPAALESCAAFLETAVQRMASLEARLREEPAAGSDKVVPGMRMELEFVRRELRNVHALMEQASAFYMHWAGLLSLAGAGYTASGRPAAAASTGRIAVQG
jgi:hypothetical protein